jgi:hypothetical protein
MEDQKQSTLTSFVYTGDVLHIYGIFLSLNNCRLSTLGLFY